MYERLSSKLRIGERIGLGFGLIGLLLLSVIVQYHVSLGQVISDHRVLQEVYENKETQAQKIEVELLRASRAAADFLLYRDERDAGEVTERIRRLIGHADELKQIDDQGRRSGEQITALAQNYLASFEAILEAWRRKGLDHESGLQGAFRKAAHRLEELAGNYEAGILYLHLLQIRRSEKDLGLRREVQYRDKVYELIDGFSRAVQDSDMLPEVRGRLSQEIEAYRRAFTDYASLVLSDQDISGGKGPFRQVAHRIEDVLNAHFVPNMEEGILQLRRREKDYLLRYDKAYVDMVRAELKGIHGLVDGSAIAAEEKARLAKLLGAYARDFLALVAQNDQIDRLLGEMEQAASSIFPLVEENVRNADEVTVAVTERINQSVHARAALLLWISIGAALIGLILAFVITRRVTRPLLAMSNFLDQLAYEEPTQRISTTPGARDELNAMAESVNRMADHKVNLIAWWKRSMEEMQAARDELAARHSPAEGGQTRDEAQTALVEAQRAKAELLVSSCRQMKQFVNEILGLAAEKASPRRTRQTLEQLSTAAKALLSQLEVLLAQVERERNTLSRAQTSEGPDSSRPARHGAQRVSADSSRSL